MKKADVFLKKHPEMLPKLTQDGNDVVSWPSEALKYLERSYKPKKRRFSVFDISFQSLGIKEGYRLTHIRLG